MSWFSGFEHIVRENEVLAPYTWFRRGGPAQYFAEPTTVEELSSLVKKAREDDIDVRVLGGGSNLLVRDEGVAGLIVNLNAAAFSQISVSGQTVTAGGGAKLGHVVSTAVREGLSGLEHLVGIPGTIGGALHGNAGTHGGNIGQWTLGATVMTRNGELITRERADLRFAYRESSLDELAIVSADFELETEDPQELVKRMQKLWIVKRSAQPTNESGSGCIFKDPTGDSAGNLIEAAGLKGARVGEAEVFERDPNFILASPAATSDDIVRLTELIKAGVADRTGVELELALEIW